MLRTLSALSSRLASVVSLVLLSASAARGAEPGPPPVLAQLEYTREPAARSCASPEQLTRDVEQRLGRRVFVTASEADITARVNARRVRDRFVIDVELVSREQSLGRRELSTRARHCSSLDDSLALVLALAVDRAPEARPNLRASAAPSTPASLDTPLVIPEATHAPRLGWVLLPSAGVTLAHGLFPSVALGVELGLELRAPGFWPVAVRGAGWPTRREDVIASSEVSGRAASFSARTLELSVCPWGSRFGSVELLLCAVEWLGRVEARGLGFDQAEQNDGWLAAAGVAPAVAYRVGPLSVSLGTALLVPLVRRRYFFENGTDITLYQQPWLLGAGALRVGVEL